MTTGQLPEPDWLADALEQFYLHGLVVLPRILTTSLCQQLHLEAQQAALQPAGVGRGQSLQLNTEIRRDQTLWLDGSSAAQRQYLGLMQQIQQAANRRCFLGLTHHEAHFARYQQGDFYQKHLDAFHGRSNRALTTVCYLNDVASGGQLQIYTEDDQPLMQIQPQTGTLVMFESTRFPHEVLPADSVRFSIAGWFRTD
jgi:SM-20-related protein